MSRVTFSMIAGTILGVIAAVVGPKAAIGGLVVFAGWCVDQICTSIEERR